jgi:hypothetical protein
VHSRYVRRLSDGAFDGRPVVILLVVRRLFCVNPDCVVRTFAEQVEGLSAPYRRRTAAVLAMLEQVGLALAGRAGARLAARLGIRVHPSTLLRLVRAIPEIRDGDGADTAGRPNRSPSGYGTIPERR